MKRFLFSLQENPGKQARSEWGGNLTGWRGKKMVEGRRRRKLFGYSRLLSAAASAEAATSTTSCSNRARGWFWVGESPNLNALITTTKGERFFPLWVGAKTYFVTLSLSLLLSLFPLEWGRGGKEENWEYTGCWGGEKLLIPADKGWENIQEFQILPYHRDTHTLILFPPYLVLNISMPYHAFPTFQVSEKIYHHDHENACFSSRYLWKLSGLGHAIVFPKKIDDFLVLS